MSTGSTTMLRRSLYWVGIGFAVLAGTSDGWRNQPGGSATRAVIAVAALICPDLSAALPAVPARRTVADGAHALDRAMFRRGLDALDIGQRRCRWPMSA